MCVACNRYMFTAGWCIRTCAGVHVHVHVLVHSRLKLGLWIYTLHCALLQLFMCERQLQSTCTHREHPHTLNHLKTTPLKLQLQQMCSRATQPENQPPPTLYLHQRTCVKSCPVIQKAANLCTITLCCNSCKFQTVAMTSNHMLHWQNSVPVYTHTHRCNHKVVMQEKKPGILPHLTLLYNSNVKALPYTICHCLRSINLH